MNGWSSPTPPDRRSTWRNIQSVETGTGAVNVYFLRQALHQGTVPSTNRANYNVNLENRLVARLDAATATIDMAAYELNLPGVVNALIAAAGRGVLVRLIVDGKFEDPDFDQFNYNWMKLHYERLARAGVRLLADTAIFAETAVARRQEFRTFFGIPAAELPDDPAGGPFLYVQACVGTTNRCAPAGYNREGYLIADAERRASGEPAWYYSPGDQMHNKFAVADGAWIWTGSWNFTINDTFASCC